MRTKNYFFIFFISLLLTISLTAVFYLGDSLFSLPFPPFDIFSWLTRVFPGPIVTFGIDGLVDFLTFLDLNVADTAKTAEKILAIIIFIIGSSGFQTIIDLTTKKKLQPRALSLLTGLIPGLFVSYIHAILPFSNNGNLISSVVWIIILFLIWGFLGVSLFNEWPIDSAPLSSDEYSVIVLNRRKLLLKIGGSTAVITLIGSGLSYLINRDEDDRVGISDNFREIQPSGDNSDTNKPVIGTRSETTPVDSHYLIDINPRPPIIQEDNYRLRVYGLVQNELLLSLNEIKENYDIHEEYVTISCISNPVGGNLIGTTRWKGSNLRQILDEAKLTENAKFIEIKSIDGYHETVSLDLIDSEDRIMLCYEWDGMPLTHEHGFPLRIWIPDLYGMKMPRWITEIEVIQEDRPGYWVVRGWDEKAQVKITSVIDTIGSPYTGSDNQVYVPIGGIAYSGDRGISRVEIRVNDGNWFSAKLFEPLSENTWVLWRYDLQFIEGNNTFSVRTYDNEGTLQTDQIAPPHPSGASGYHSVSERL